MHEQSTNLIARQQTLQAMAQRPRTSRSLRGCTHMLSRKVPDGASHVPLEGANRHVSSSLAASILLLCFLARPLFLCLPLASKHAVIGLLWPLGLARQLWLGCQHVVCYASSQLQIWLPLQTCWLRLS